MNSKKEKTKQELENEALDFRTGYGHRVIFKSMGFTSEELSLPRIAVVNSWSEQSPGHSHLRAMSEGVKAGIRMAGGMPFEINVIGPCTVLGRDPSDILYDLPQREAILASIESALRVGWCDGWVGLGSCDKIVPGMLLAAIRMDRPFIFIGGGQMLPSDYEGERFGFVRGMEIISEEYNRLQEGILTQAQYERELEALTDCCGSSAGACGEMTTGNSMQLLTEALGFSVPGSSTSVAVSAEKIWQSKETGKRIVDLAQKQIKPSDIFTLSSIPDAEAIRSHVSAMKDKEVVIVGAGLIGLEMADAFATMDLKVTVLEALGWPLPTLLDFDIASQLEKHLRSKGVNLVFGQPVTGFTDDGRGNVRGVRVGDNEVGASLVLLSLGVRPDVFLASDAGLEIGQTGGLAVNEYLQTSDPDIYAGGDCIETVNLVTGDKTLVPLGSTANKHGRVIGTNVTGGRETFPGVMGTAITKVFDMNVGRVGLSESQAREAGFDVVTALVPSFEHATYYPGAREITVKLVAEKPTGRLLGGQAVGPGDTAKRIDVLATALAFRATAADLAELDLAYAPPYNSAMDPIHNAANVIRNKQEGYARGLTPAEVKQKLDADEDFVLLDVRSLMEWLALR